MIAQNSNKKEKNKVAVTAIRQRRKIKKEMHSVSDNDDDDESISELSKAHKKNGRKNVYNKEDNLVDSRLMEIDLDNNEEEDSSLISNLTVDVTSTTESSFFIALQVFFPFFAAGLGTVAAGLLLDHVQVILLSGVLSTSL